MFKRSIYHGLEQWKLRKNRLPLIVRGARQTGKTTIIKEFAKQFKHFIYLNLEDTDTRKLITASFDETIKLIELKISKKIPRDNTLIFIDEIQASPEAVSHIRFFLEKMPEVFLICAGSLLEIKLSKKQISFPTGRVEYLFLTPMSLYEYLDAAGKRQHLEVIYGDPKAITQEIHNMLMEEVYSYFQIGGMPAAVQSFQDTKSFAEVKRFHLNLYQSILDDIGKYVSKSEEKYIQLVFESAPLKIAERIIYGNFNNSGYRCREIKHAFDILQKAFLVYRILPTSTVNLPAFHNLGKAPKLFFFDTGMVNSRLMQPFNKEQITANSSIRGNFSEQFIFQELLALQKQLPESLYFWTRETKNSHAEIDFCGAYNGSLVPIEVKYGPAGKLRSVGVFMEQAPHKIAVRFYNGLPSINHNVHTGKGVPFTLINIPLYLAGRWQDVVAGYLM